MPDPDARQRLVDLLETRIFQPIFDASADAYEAAEDRERLTRVQRAAHAEANRYRGLQTAEEVVEEYYTDLELDREQDVYRELHSLGLPALPDIRTELENAARSLDVTR